MNERPRAEFLFVGPTQDVADLAFQQASGMIEADPEGYLQKRFHIQEHLKTITDRRNKAKLKIKTFDMRVMTGVKPTGVLVDELHTMSSYAYAGRVIGQIRGGLLPNPEAFLIFITTQSDQPPSGVFRAELQYARAVRDGRVTKNVRTLPILYEFPERMQTDPAKPWADPSRWPMVLPNLGRSITIERLTADAEAAREKGEEEFRRWASQHLNVEIGLALHSDRWAGADHWKARGDQSLSLTELLARSEVVTIGIDGGGMDDLLGLSVIGRDRATKGWLDWNHAWAHPTVLQRRKEIAPKLRDFAEDGDLTIVEQLGKDIEGVVDVVRTCDEAGLLAGVGLDPVGIGAIVDALDEIGVNGDRVVGIPQGWKLAGAIKTVERKLADGTFTHAGQPMMAWCVGNAKVEPRGNAIMITKQAAGTAKIDPLMATFNAAALMATNPRPMGAIEQAFVEL
jgi:phage terminase large subunit-like protein